MTTIKVERFAAGGMALVAKREIAPADRASERATAKAMLADCYCQQPGYDPLRVLESLYRAVRDGAALAA